MKLFMSILSFMIFTGIIYGQDERQDIIGIVDQLFDGMRAGDSSAISDLFTKEATLASIFTNNTGEVVKRSGSILGFINAVGTPHDDIWDERIWTYDIKLDEPLASVWTEYTFYLGENLSHCGVNVFEMIHLKDGWKISSITDTRRSTNCKTKEESEINLMMDNWHAAAAVGDEDTFFGSMTEDGIYIGTDASERWLRDEMKEWSKKYFERDSAWSFTPISRTIEIGKDKEVAWFDELLDTWMGTCRSSGVVTKTPDGWRIRHYHLSIAVPNEKVDGYLELIGKPRK